VSGFLYFKPNQQRNVKAEDVKAWGLSYAVESPPESRPCQLRTPTGGAGVVFADPSRHAQGAIKMDMEAQEWRLMKRPGDCEIYIGVWKDSPPQPADLARKNQLGGYWVTLADGKQWLCPVVRYFDESAAQLRSNLPSYLDIGDDGELVPGQVLPLHAHLWDITAPYAEQMLADADGGGPDVSAADISKAARTLLQVNYTVGANEIAAARILTTEQMTHNIVAVAVDWPTYLKWREVSKKKTPSLVTAGG